MFYVLFAFIAVLLIFTVLFVLSSLQEKAHRAAGLGLVASAAITAVLVVCTWAFTRGLLASGTAQVVQMALILVAVVFAASMFLPVGRRPEALAGTAGMKVGTPERLNQKETAFNIAHVGGYGAKVGKRRWALLKDDPFGGLFYGLCMLLRPQVDGNVNPGPKPVAGDITADIKRAARYLGADLVGITTVKEDFTYSEKFSYEDSKIGVGPAVTSPCELNHKYIIVLAKEMNFDRINATLTNKNDESAAEVGRTYYDLANIACSLAAYIRQLGFPARAHHLRNEQVFLVPHAIDAGLGEQGRHNYLITGKYGPRVRLAGVTTTLRLREDKPVDIGVQDFCENCRICELNCPSQALAAEKATIRGYRKWPQNQEKCFKFWVSGGNTFVCSVCLKLCPWNKPRTLVHKVSFMAASRSAVARKVLYWMAVLFYGKSFHWTRAPLPAELESPEEAEAAATT